MKILWKLTFVLSVCALGTSLHAETASGEVGMMRHYGSGNMLVYGLVYDEPTNVSHCNGTKTAFLIQKDYEKFDRLLSLLLTAKATGSVVTVRALEVGTSCWAPTFTSSSYIDFN